MKSSVSEEKRKSTPLFISMEQVREVMQCGTSKAYSLLKDTRDYHNVRVRKHVTFREFADFVELSVDQLYEKLNISQNAA
jgi:hypothetical protein